MDGVVRALPAFALALWALLGHQGARVGSLVLPEISYTWPCAALLACAILFRRPKTSPLTLRDAVTAIVLLGLALPVHVLRAKSLRPLNSLPATVNGEPERMASLQIKRRRDLRRATGLRRNVVLEMTAVLEVRERGNHRFEIECDDSCEIELGRERIRAKGRHTVSLALDPGHLPLRIRYQQLAGPAVFRVAWDTPRPIEPFGIDLFVRAADQTASASAERRQFAILAFWIAFSWWLLLSLFAIRLVDRATTVRELLAPRTWIPKTAIALVVLYGCLLRFDALLVHSGLARDSEVHGAMHETISNWIPRFALFNPLQATDDPYRADVRSYLDRADAMSLATFYAPSFREPFYVAIVALFVRAVGSEFGVLLQSFAFSCATLVLFSWVAGRRYGWYWSLALVVPVALHEWLVLEAPTGYRMSAYGFALLALTGFALLGAKRSEDMRAAVFGTLAGLLCLIRLSALSVVVPVTAMAARRAEFGRRLRFLSIAALVAAALVVPFLLSNLAAHGDPFYSVSFHTEFWLRAEGLDEGQGSVSFVRYFTSFGRLSDLVKGSLLGLTVLPVLTFLRGLAHFPPLGWLVVGAGAIGLALDLRKSGLLLAAYLGHLVPFAYIQNFPSGEMPRFVMPAYFFLVLAVPHGAASALTLYRRVANLVRRQGATRKT